MHIMIKEPFLEHPQRVVYPASCEALVANGVVIIKHPSGVDATVTIDMFRYLIQEKMIRVVDKN